MRLSADTRTNLLTLTENAMAAFVVPLGWPAFRAQQILRWLYQERVHTFFRRDDESFAAGARASHRLLHRWANC